ncbi:MAG: DNA methylase, partial [Lachnospiraceae bacterium]|nr:DNA methylase [Lachnospiraceae bacterium]
VPKHAHGTENLMGPMSSAKHITQAFMDLYDRIVPKDLLIRRLNLVANHIVPDTGQFPCDQLNLFTDYLALQEKQEAEQKSLEKERKMQQAMIDIKKKFGKNAILKGMNLEEGATMKERNRQIGGHRE